MSLYVSHIAMLPIELWAQRFHLPLKPSIIQDEPCGNPTLKWMGTFSISENQWWEPPQFFWSPLHQALSAGALSAPASTSKRTELTWRKPNQNTWHRGALFHRGFTETTPNPARWHDPCLQPAAGALTYTCRMAAWIWIESESKQLRSRAEHRISRAPQMGPLEPSGLVPIQFQLEISAYLSCLDQDQCRRYIGVFGQHQSVCSAAQSSICLARVSSWSNFCNRQLLRPASAIIFFSILICCIAASH